MNKPVRLVAESVPDTAFTVRDYARLMEFGDFQEMRVELVRGELRKMMMPAGFLHGEMTATLAYELRVAFTGTDRRFATDLAIEIDSLTVRGGDIAVVLPDTPRTGPGSGTLRRDGRGDRADYAGQGHWGKARRLCSGRYPGLLDRRS